MFHQRRIAMKIKKFIPALTAIALVSACALPASAALITFVANLDGGQEVPPNGSAATGFGTVVLDDTTDMITVNESWTGLSAPAIVSHIHGPAPAGVTTGVLFPFTGVPSATSGSIPQQVFTLTAAQVTELENGLLYMNVHTRNYPAGEIRGQLVAVPEMSPGWAGIMVMGALCFGRKIYGKGRDLVSG